MSLVSDRSVLPRGRHLALTWGIPDGFGGMTGAMLHRSRAFARIGGVEVDVLTLDARPDHPQIEERLRAAGELVDGMRLINLWDWLREHPLRGGSLRLDRHAFDPIDVERDAAELGAPRRRGDLVLSRTRVDADGAVLQTDHYREDGTLLVSDRRDATTRGEPGGRSVVLCDEAGRPVRSWSGIRRLYATWLDALTAKRPTWLIVDSKTVAPFALGYRRAHVVTAHVVHASHLVGTARPHGRLRESRREVFERLDGYDAVVVLTERQRADIEAMLGRHRNVVVVPNARDLGGIAPGAADERDPRRGIVLAGLSTRKRVDHAVRAVANVDAAGGAAPQLDVYGDGDLRGALERQLAELEHGDRVRLRGHDPSAPQRLASSSFLLLTSTSEGFPLVLVESMAAGCIPIAYDVPYGPADMIRDGRNGLLVPAGDEEALAESIARVTTMPPAELARMRRESIRTARRFDDEHVTAAWARTLRRARLEKDYREASDGREPSAARLAGFVIARRVRRQATRARRRLARARAS